MAKRIANEYSRNGLDSNNGMFPKGVSYYTTATVEIGFPENNVICMLCPLLETYSRNQCRATGEYIIHPESYIGGKCPLNFCGNPQKNHINENEVIKNEQNQ